MQVDFIACFTMKITETWNGLKFLYSNHSHFLLLTCPHSFVLLKKWIKCVKYILRHFFCFFPFPYLKFEIVSCINQCISLTINSQKNVGRSAKESEVGCCTKTMSPIHGLVIFVPLNNINECLINWKAQHTKLNSEVISHFFIGKHSCLTNIKKKLWWLKDRNFIVNVKNNLIHQLHLFKKYLLGLVLG